MTTTRPGVVAHTYNISYLMLEISLRYWGVTRETQYNSEVNRSGNIYFCRRMWHKKQAHSACGVLSLMQCCPFPELGRFGVHSLHGWLIGKRTSGEGIEDKDV
jgi:hypothetical protein